MHTRNTAFRSFADRAFHPSAPRPRSRLGQKRVVRGYSLMLVLGLLALLAVAISGLVQVVVSSTHVTRALVKERRSFYAADDLCRIVAKLSQPYLASTVNPSKEGLTAFLESPEVGNGELLPALVPDGWEMTEFVVDNLVGPYVAPVPNGPFEGMSASQSRVKMTVTVQPVGGGASRTCSQEVVLGSVSAFQFYIFGDVFLDWNPVPLMLAKGHAHSNYDFCIGGRVGSDKGLRLEKITSSERILHASDPDCRYPYDASDFNNTLISKTKTPNFGGTGDFENMAAINDHNCGGVGSTHLDNCGGDKSWAVYSMQKWKGQVLDSAHGVTKLSLPVSGAASVQAGRNVSIQDGSMGPDDYGESNIGNSRFVIDPVLPSDPPDIRDQKFAFKSDIRIINGAWYIKSEDDPEQWPGIPIWSDHPGTHVVQNLEQIEGTDSVGQADLRAARVWGTSTPRRFSYYGFDENTGQMTWEASHGPAVISYGTLGRVAHSSDDVYWYPHHWTAPEAYLEPVPALVPAPVSDGGTPSVPHPMCKTSPDITGCLDTGTQQACFFSVDSSLGGTPADCGVDGNLNARTALLNGTRSGFRYAYTEVKGPPGGSVILGTGSIAVTQHEERLARVLPVNFDMAAFQAALQDCSPGELGSYFPGTCGAGGREFNGIVYITSTWKGVMDGLGTSIATSGFAQYPPLQGDELATGSTQPPPLQGFAPIVGLAQNHELPFPLCSDTLNDQWFETPDAATSKFKIPACAKFHYTSTTPPILQTRPNAVQIVNAKYINPKNDRNIANGRVTLLADFLPKGLTVATNLPMFVVGDVNTDTDPEELDASHSGYHFTPLLFAADHVTFHSSNYNDAFNGWERLREVTLGTRIADDTTYNCSLYVGWLPSSDTSPPYPSDGIENLFRFHEEWGGKDLVFNGAQVVGFSSVFGYAGAVRSGALGIGNAPIRKYSYDKHLDALANQPPGAPLYEISGIYNWRSE